MNSKSKIWQIVLLALLVLAIIAILLFNNKLNASKQTLSTTLAQLTEEQENSATLKADLDTAKTEYEAVSAELEQAKADVESGKAEAKKLQGDLTTANERVTELETAATESEAKITELETAATESEAKITELETAATESAAKVTELEGTVSKRDETIKTLKSAATEAEAKITELETAATKSAAKVTELEGTVSKRDETIKTLKSAATEAEAKIAELESAVTERDELLSSMNTDAAETESTDAAQDATEAGSTDAERNTEGLATAIANLEGSIVKVAGLQAEAGEAAEGVADIDLDAVRQEIAGIVEDTAEDVTDEERIEALAEIQQKLDAALPTGGDDASSGEGENADAALETMQAQLDAAEEEVEQLSTELAEKLEDIDTLNASIAALDAQAETDAAKLEELQTQLAEAQDDAQAQREAMDEAGVAYAKNLAEMQAYKLDREPVAGEAHLSTEVNNVIQVAADGVTADWQYANSDLSGNTADVALTVDGEAIWSGELKPGETLDGITLDKALEAGEYQAMVVTTVYDAAGEHQLTSRVPVTLNVAAE